VNNGKAKRINQNWAAVTYVMNGVTSSYNAFTAEVRHQVAMEKLMQSLSQPGIYELEGCEVYHFPSVEVFLFA